LADETCAHLREHDGDLPVMTDKTDIYDGEPWTEMAVRDLTAALNTGSTIEEAAEHLCRSGTVDDVRRKADELGLAYRRE